MSHSTLNTRNPLVSAFMELGLDFSQDITKEVIMKAYEKYILIYNKMLEDGKIPDFKIEDKEEAANYLIEFYCGKNSA
jgi:hypothetical protein